MKYFLIQVKLVGGHWRFITLYSDGFSYKYKWALARENLSLGFGINKGADPLSHPSRLISAFVIRFLESIISKLDTGKISNF